jgi:predicted site-specific integrase-resolvase
VTNEDVTRYTMGVNEVRQRLKCSRQTVHDLATAGVLSYRTKQMGRVNWKYFDPAEVEAYAEKRGVPSEALGRAVA